jgi:hypothetical protein
MADSSESFVCRTCGKTHAGLPISFAADFPDPYANLSADQREARAVIGSDQCILDSELFFIRGLVEIPIVDSNELFLWGVWATVFEDVFEQLSESWTTVGREAKFGPFKGRLANSLSIYPATLNLKLEIRLRPVGQRPIFIIEDADHLLAIQQRDGITKHEVSEMASMLMSADGQPWARS